jgi:integrase/recombinase XerD
MLDVDFHRGTLMVREGKGRRQRVIPIGDRALGWIGRYLEEVRPGLVVAPDPGQLFLTHHGGAFEKSSLTEMVRVLVKEAGIGKQGSVHLIRHTMATLMLEGGADVRYVQAMLGHSRLETTALYTQVAVRKLKEVHTRSHPARSGRGPDLQNSESPDSVPD